MVSVSSLSLSLPWDELVSALFGNIDAMGSSWWTSWQHRWTHMIAWAEELRFVPESLLLFLLYWKTEESVVCARITCGPTVSYGKQSLVIKINQIHFIWHLWLSGILGNNHSSKTKTCQSLGLLFTELIKPWHWWLAATQTATSYKLWIWLKNRCVE